MTLRHLKVFVCVCKHGSITRAAEELMVAQPAVSKTISEMEKYYGVMLFSRIKQRLFPTDEGKELLINAKEVLSSFEKFEETAFSSKAKTSVSIGSSLTIGKTFMPDMIRKIKTKFPSADIKAFVNKTSVIEGMILNGEIDFAFIEGNPSSSGIAAEEAVKDHLAAVSGTKYRVKEPLQLWDLKDYDLLLREKGSASRDFFDSILTLNHTVATPFLESASNQALISAAVNDLGIAILPQTIVREYLENGSLRQIKNSILSVPRTSYVIYGKSSVFRGTKYEIFVFCRDEFKNIGLKNYN